VRILLTLFKLYNKSEIITIHNILINDASDKTIKSEINKFKFFLFYIGAKYFNVLSVICLIVHM